MANEKVLAALGTCDLTASGATREALEKAAMRSGRRLYGALPHYGDLQAHLTGTGQDLEAFEAAGIKLDERQTQAVLLHRLKFGDSIHSLIGAVIASLPDLGKKGRILGVYGLSGCGKSLLAEGIKESSGRKDVIVLDSDSCRCNLLGAPIRDLELANGATLDEVRNHLLHNPAASGILYVTLETVAAVLRSFGYTLVMSATAPARNADVVYYVAHPDVDPASLDVPEDLNSAEPQYEAFQRAAALLARITDERCPGQPDTFDWTRGQTTNPFWMVDVVVKVPAFVHKIFIGNVKKMLAGGGHIVIQNPRAATREQAKANLLAQLAL